MHTTARASGDQLPCNPLWQLLWTLASYPVDATDATATTCAGICCLSTFL